MSGRGGGGFSYTDDAGGQPKSAADTDAGSNGVGWPPTRALSASAGHRTALITATALISIAT
jgi:hypothetical protein